MTSRFDAAVKRCAAQWEANGQADAAFAALTSKTGADRRWRSEDFFARGVEEIDLIWAHLEANAMLPGDTTQALDFGCGAGRLTAALARRFDHVTGVDVSASMIAAASNIIDDPRVSFVVNCEPDLSVLDPVSYDFIYSNIVLQHIPAPLQLRYVGEFVRLLAPGGTAVFQTASRRSGFRGLVERVLPAPALNFLRARRRPPELHRRDDYQLHMDMNCVTERKVRAAVAGAGGRLLQVVYTNATEPDFGGQLEVLDRQTARRRARGGHYVSSVFIVNRL